MRIVGGIYRSRVLNEFEKIGVRPTSDRVRESLFNILSLKIKNSVFLDLFSGTGAVGIEALSRGAKKAYFVDNSMSSIKLIKSNLERLNISDGAVVTFSRAEEFLKRAQENFDIVYIDPPYASEIYKEIINLALSRMNDGGMIIAESDAPFDFELDGEIFDKRKYGKSHLTFIRKGE